MRVLSYPSRPVRTCRFCAGSGGSRQGAIARELSRPSIQDGHYSSPRDQHRLPEVESRLRSRVVRKGHITVSRSDVHLLDQSDMTVPVPMSTRDDEDRALLHQGDNRPVVS